MMMKQCEKCQEYTDNIRDGLCETCMDDYDTQIKKALENITQEPWDDISLPDKASEIYWLIISAEALLGKVNKEIDKEIRKECK